MTERELRKLKRGDLLEMLTEQAQRIEEQACKLEELQRQVDDRSIKIEKSGSIAEAALTLNNVFVSAQSAADEYLASIRDREAQREQELANARQEAQEIIAAARKSAEEIEANAHEHMARMVSEAVDQLMQEKKAATVRADSAKRRSGFWRRNG